MPQTKKRQTRALKRSGASRRSGGSKVSAARSRAKAKAPAARTPAAARAKGLQSISPGFTVNDATASVKWYCDVLGFTRGETWEQDGKYLGGTVVQGPVTINIGQDDWKLGRDRQKGQGVRVYITTAEDVDAYAKRITSRGGTLEHEPRDEWGVRTFSLKDPDGYRITIMRPLK